jgi:hypothetical protein
LCLGIRKSLFPDTLCHSGVRHLINGCRCFLQLHSPVPKSQEDLPGPSYIWLINLCVAVHLFNISASRYPRIRPTANMPAPTTLDDPEKGAMQIVTPEAVAMSLAKVRPTSQIHSADFKVNETTLDQIKSQLIAASQTQKPAPPKKVQRKVSRFIRFSLWFNTYRLVHCSYDNSKSR